MCSDVPQWQGVSLQDIGFCTSLRYLYQDDMPGAVRGSPAVKTATLARDSAALAAGVLQQLDDSVARMHADQPLVIASPLAASPLTSSPPLPLSSQPGSFPGVFSWCVILSQLPLSWSIMRWCSWTERFPQAFGEFK